MPTDITAFLSACSRIGLLLDTNSLVLLCVGKQDRSSIGRDTRTSNYSDKDYDLLVRLVKYSNYRLYITPYIVSEVSNLIVDKKNGQSEYFTIAKELVKKTEESHHHKDDILIVPELRFLGFTDVSIIKAVEETKCAIITSDSFLYSKLLEKGQNAAHLQTMSALGSNYIN